MKITIPGEPLAKARHRTYLMGRSICTYDPQTKEKKIFQDHLINELRKIFSGEDKQKALEAGLLAHSDAFDVDLTFYMPFSKSKSQGLQNRFLWNLEIVNQKPDLDNLEKLCLDFCKGILYQDDRQIVSLKSKKVYSDNPRTEITIMPHKKIELPEIADKILQSISPEDYKKLSDIIIAFQSSVYEMQAIQGEKMENLTDYERFRLTNIACNISLLADTFGTYLANIKKKYPKFHEEVEKVLPNNAQNRIKINEGKTLC